MAPTWQWQGHTIGFSQAGPEGDTPDRSTVILIHGFGACSAHWRHNLPVLAERFDVYALDLLGFGASAKPRSRLKDEPQLAGSVRYCFDLWATQVSDFVASLEPNQRRGPLQLVGNSIGGLVALRACQVLESRGIAPTQVILIDCAQRTLDEKRIAKLPAFERRLRPLVKQLVRQRRIVAPLFRILARPSFIRQVLAKAYPSGANIDAELVEILHRPSTDPGAAESFRGFINLFDDHLAPELLADLSVPVRLLWGERDPWESPAEALEWSEQFDCIQELRVLPGLGHCPHDEAPEQVNPVLLEWLSLGESEISATGQSGKRRGDQAT
ncbi:MULTISPECIES: alpha/beta fold hydrolase [unclassified Synechococcus]|uniref:alpha/beta fold hydrolase n=1 Tax=unclassified Synechococcus TaxID=2626047 RepID=UPI000B275E2F|nr:MULTISPECIES: alpha/beta fold hydrolase [unclassified Synechococcus]MCT4366408.1 alpha/beta fold hydrolase [Candidatus Regnicoccus frigidus MAG-AL2]TWB90406.1 pimeloyl-ACP methyl ester carboxylesterase [Synechococcus sp. Ace-Pa]